MTKILIDEFPESCSDCPLFQERIEIPINSEFIKNIPAECKIGKTYPKCLYWFKKIEK